MTAPTASIPMPTARASERTRGFLLSPAWGLYLVLAVALVPVLKPAGPAQFALIDGLNLVAMICFVGAMIASRKAIEIPFAVPILMISLGSLIALVNAENMKYGLMTMAQDAYLYLWFVVLVNLLSRREGDLRRVRIAWVASAALMGVIGLAILLTDGRTQFTDLFGARGNRAWAFFQSPNTFADYLVMSVFVGLSLFGQMSRMLLGLLLGIILLALVATKSNGAMGAMMVGLVAWMVVKAVTRKSSPVPVIGIGLLLSGLLVFGLWAQREFHPTAEPLEAIGEGSFVARAGNSSESRQRIWNTLMRHWEQSPLGIGAGNSRFIRLSVGERERRTSYFSKEPHNDYLGYLIERGPLAVLGLALLMIQPLVQLRRRWRTSVSRVWRRTVASPLMAALVGGLVASSIHSLVMEKLHFRHFWFFMALLCAVREPLSVRLGGARRGNALDSGPQAGGIAGGRLAEAV
jgi:O-antigen ligase